MAQAYLKTSRLRLVFDHGVDDNNKPIYKAKVFNNINRESSPDQLYQASHAISTLKTEPLWAIERNDTFDIDE